MSLELPQSTPVQASARLRAPCATNPDNWDLDTGNPSTWRQAVQTCYACPLFAQCSELAEKLADTGQSPQAMIWAGVGYDNAGNVVHNLDQYRHPAVDRQRRMKIIRMTPAARPTVEPRPVKEPSAGHPVKHLTICRRPQRLSRAEDR